MDRIVNDENIHMKNSEQLKFGAFCSFAQDPSNRAKILNLVSNPLTSILNINLLTLLRLFLSL